MEGGMVGPSIEQTYGGERKIRRAGGGIDGARGGSPEAADNARCDENADDETERGERDMSVHNLPSPVMVVPE